MNVAVIGMGRMGAAMVGTLTRAGNQVTVHNRTRAASEAVAAATGATVADSPQRAVERADVILTSLADDSAVRDVYANKDGIAAGVGAGAVVIEMSTITPSVITEIGTLIDAAGAHFLDAPVSGSVMLVEQGNLTIMVGGEAEALDIARPVLEALAANIFHVGRRGSGATVKLAVNALVHGINGSLAEALVLAEKAGVDRETAYEVFAAGAGGAPFLQYKKGAYLDPDAAPVAFSLDLVAKDLSLITGLGKQVGASMPISEAGLSLTNSAIASGLGDRDMSALAIHLREE